MRRTFYCREFEAGWLLLVRFLWQWVLRRVQHCLRMLCVGSRAKSHTTTRCIQLGTELFCSSVILYPGVETALPKIQPLCWEACPGLETVLGIMPKPRAHLLLSERYFILQYVLDSGWVCWSLAFLCVVGKNCGLNQIRLKSTYSFTNNI